MYSIDMNRLDEPIVRSLYSKLKYKYPSTSSNFAILKISIPNQELMKEYEKQATKHNKKLMNNIFYDSGFDLLIPEDTTFESQIFKSQFIDFNIKTEMLYCEIDKDLVTSSPYYIHPRSSMSKTPLMLSNHTGIIDSGYRGNIIGAFRYLDDPGVDCENPYILNKFTRLLQVCHPSLCPVFIVFVDEKSLSNTERGTNGFGSTGV